MGNMVQLKYLIHPTEEKKYQKWEKIKEEALQGSIYTTTSMINPRHCPRKNVMSLLNSKSTRRMAVRSRNTTKETQTIRSRPIIMKRRK